MKISSLLNNEFANPDNKKSISYRQSQQYLVDESGENNYYYGEKEFNAQDEIPCISNASLYPGSPGSAANSMRWGSNSSFPDSGINENTLVHSSGDNSKLMNCSAENSNRLNIDFESNIKLKTECGTGLDFLVHQKNSSFSGSAGAPNFNYNPQNLTTEQQKQELNRAIVSLSPNSMPNTGNQPPNSQGHARKRPFPTSSFEDGTNIRSSPFEKIEIVAALDYHFNNQKNQIGNKNFNFSKIPPNFNNNDSNFSFNSPNNNNKSKNAKICANCFIEHSTNWRRHPKSNEYLCNACGLYVIARGKPRPIKNIMRRSKASMNNNLSSNSTKGLEFNQSGNQLRQSQSRGQYNNNPSNMIYPESNQIMSDPRGNFYQQSQPLQREPPSQQRHFPNPRLETNYSQQYPPLHSTHHLPSSPPHGNYGNGMNPDYRLNNQYPRPQQPLNNEYQMGNGNNGNYYNNSATTFHSNFGNQQPCQGQVQPPPPPPLRTPSSQLNSYYNSYHSGAHGSVDPNGRGGQRASPPQTPSDNFQPLMTAKSFPGQGPHSINSSYYNGNQYGPNRKDGPSFHGPPHLAEQGYGNENSFNNRVSPPHPGDDSKFLHERRRENPSYYNPNNQSIPSQPINNPAVPFQGQPINYQQGTPLSRQIPTNYVTYHPLHHDQSYNQPTGNNNSRNSNQPPFQNHQRENYNLTRSQSDPNFNKINTNNFSNFNTNNNNNSSNFIDTPAKSNNDAESPSSLKNFCNILFNSDGRE